MNYKGYYISIIKGEYGFDFSIGTTLQQAGSGMYQTYDGALERAKATIDILEHQEIERMDWLASMEARKAS